MPLSSYIRFEHRIKPEFCKEFRFAFCYSDERMIIFVALVFQMYLELSYLVVIIMVSLFRYIQGTEDGFRSKDKRSESVFGNIIGQCISIDFYVDFFAGYQKIHLAMHCCILLRFGAVHPRLKTCINTRVKNTI